MENKELLQNIEQIKHYDIELYNKILMFDNKKANIQLAQNENGEYNLLYDSIPLHSIENAVLEAQQIAQNVEESENSLRIIYGLGLGYLVDVFANKFSKNTIIVYEPNIDIINYVFSVAQIDAFLKENVILCSDKTKLKMHVQNFVDENTKLTISFLNSYKGFIEDIKDVLYVAQSSQGEIIGNKNTFLKKAQPVFYHTLLNLKYVYSNPSILDLKDVYKDKTAIILCAGPSLKENIELIKENQDKFVIFALNPTLNLLAQHDIKPDFIVAVENTNISKQFENINLEKCYLIQEAFTNNYVTRLKTRKTFNYFSNENFFNYWLKDSIKNNDDLKAAGTVSYYALQSAFLMGFNKIILVGQDLAYKDGLCYSKECQWGALECVFDEDSQEYKIIPTDWEKLIDAYLPLAKTREKAIESAQKRIEFLNKNLCTVKSQDDKYIPTKTDYAIFIKSFEQAAIEIKREKAEIKLINSSFGAQIDGYENIKLNKIVEVLKPIEKINLDNYSNCCDKNYLIEKVDKLYLQMQKYQNLLQEFILINEQILNNCDLNDFNLIQNHNEILRKIIELSTEKDIDFIINVHFNINEKYFKVNYFENVDVAKKVLFELNEQYKKYHIATSVYSKVLCNSKSFILE